MSERLPVGIVGAGLAGLVAANELRRRDIPFEVYEAAPVIGGLARSFKDEDGFSLDVGAHFITNRLAAAVGVDAQCRTVDYYGESVWYQDASHSYPFGLLREPRFVRSALSARLAGGGPPHSAAESFRQQYGEALSQAVAEPLLEAWSGAPADQLSPDVAGKITTSIPKTVWLRLAARATNRAVAIGYCREQPENANVWHVYPENGISTVVEALADRVRDAVHLETPIESIVVEDGAVRSLVVDGNERPMAAVISTAPVTVLPKIVEGTDALGHLASFRYRPMTFVNLMLEGRDLLPDVVTWTPEADFPFFRLTEAPMSMPWLAPEGKTIITVDIGCERGDEVWESDDDELAARCLDALEPIVPGVADRFLKSRVLRTPIAYPVFHLDYERERQAWAVDSGIEGLVSIGRNGEFEHILMEDLYWRTLRRIRRLAATLQRT